MDAGPRPLASMTALQDFAARHRRLFVLTGAGISTDSGIPGYRDDAGQWRKAPPVMLQDFLASAASRRRYWARSMHGWPLVGRAQPNAGHAALARLERARRVVRTVTQNVDGLHQRAGSADVVELHGSVGRVVCLQCRTLCAREDVQRALEAANPGFAGAGATVAPDGDADVTWPDLDAFVVPECAHCGGMLKPDVVFFGEGVPRVRVDAARAALDAADAMLVVGSSLMVWSGYRFCEAAHAAGKPIAAINRGRTRADHLFEVKVEDSCGAALAALADGT